MEIISKCCPSFCALRSALPPSAFETQSTSTEIAQALEVVEASTVVFLSPMLTDTSFVQAAGRVVRQGSYHARVRVIVLAAAQSTETDDAARVDRFRQLSQPGARD